MRKSIVYVIIFTLIFPLCCFSSPGAVRAQELQAAVPLEAGVIEEAMLLLEDEEVLTAAMETIADGQVDMEEVDNLAALIQDKIVIDRFDFYWCTYYLVQGLICLITFRPNCVEIYLDEIIFYCTLGI